MFARFPLPRGVTFTAFLTALIALSACPSAAHDTFFRVSEYDVDAGDELEVTVLHGTFTESVMRITRDHVERLFVAGPNGTRDLNKDGWEHDDRGGRIWTRWQAVRTWAGAIDKRRTSRFTITLPDPGSYALAMSLHPAGAAMKPEVFDKYLAEQGLQDEGVARHGITDPEAIITERWRKYVKLLLQVGEAHTQNVTEPVGLFVEIVPLSHPAQAKAGGTLGFQLLREGKPLPGQPVAVGRSKPAFDDPAPPRFLRSDDDGRISVPIDDAGVWWLSFVSINPAPPGDDVQWESHWATLTLNTR